MDMGSVDFVRIVVAAFVVGVCALVMWLGRPSCVSIFTGADDEQPPGHGVVVILLLPASLLGPARQSPARAQQPHFLRHLLALLFCCGAGGIFRLLYRRARRRCRR